MKDKIVAILESRSRDQVADLVRKYGGTPFSAPALAEFPDIDPDHIQALIHDWNSAPPDIFIFQTGVGTRALFAATDSLGLTEADRCSALAQRAHRSRRERSVYDPRGGLSRGTDSAFAQKPAATRTPPTPTTAPQRPRQSSLSGLLSRIPTGGVHEQYPGQVIDRVWPAVGRRGVGSDGWRSGSLRD